MARLSRAPLMTVELAEGTTVEGLFASLASTQPELGPALRSALPVVGGEHALAGRPLRQGEEVALLLPVSGG